MRIGVDLMSFKLSSVLMLLAGIMCTSPSHAEILIFTDEASWLAAVGGTPSLEDFESATSDIDFSQAPAASPNGELGLSAVEESTFTNNMLVDTLDDGGYVSSGAAFVPGSEAVLSMRFLDKSPAPDEMIISFPAGISAVAFDYNIYDNQGDSVDISFIGTNGGPLGTFSPIPPNPSTPNVGFLGIVDTGIGASISSITVAANPDLGTGSSVFASVDNVQYGVAIPEPSTALMLSMVLSVCGVAVQRNRS